MTERERKKDKKCQRKRQRHREEETMIGIQSGTSRKKKDQVGKLCERVFESVGTPTHTPAHGHVCICVVCVFTGECEKEIAQNRTERVGKKENGNLH